MNLGAIGRIGGVVAAVATVGTLAACAPRNANKSSEAVGADYVGRFDKNGDFKLNREFEVTRDETGSYCSVYGDIDGDGDSECLLTDTYTNRYTIAALAARADTKHGNDDGIVVADEIAGVVREFDTGAGKKGVKGDNILQKDEIKAFEKSYGETFSGRAY